jgi:hypothetical protein
MYSLSHPSVTSGLKSLQSNVAYKLLFVSVTSMTLPRIYVDSHRNKYAGQETAFYETYSLATNYGLPGVLALGTAHALKGVNNPFQVNPSGWVKNENVEALSDIYQRSIHEKNPHDTQRQFIKNSLASLQGVDSISGKVTRLAPQAIEAHAAHIQEWMHSDKADSDFVPVMAKKLGEGLGTYDRITMAQGEKSVGLSPEKFVSQLRYLGEEFQKGHRSEVGADIQKNVQSIAGKLKSSNNIKAAVSLSLLAGIGFSAQFINRWITKRRTGKDEFVGYSDFANGLDQSQKADNQQNDNAQPASAQGNGTPHFGKLESSQFLPTGEQLKYVIYPAGIIGKLLASRALDEFRETALKAGFAYFNFLWIPNFVENVVANSMKNKHIFVKQPQTAAANGEESGLSRFIQSAKKINNLSVRSYEDVEVYAKRIGEEFSGLNEKQLKETLNSEKFQDLLKKKDAVISGFEKLSGSEKAQRIEKAVARELHGVKNVAVLGNILYSCVTLGFGLNLLNMYITNKKTKKAAEAAAAQQHAAHPVAPARKPATPASFPQASKATVAPSFRPVTAAPMMFPPVYVISPARLVFPGQNPFGAPASFEAESA